MVQRSAAGRRGSGCSKVGGILANNNYPADFLIDNLKIQNNVIETAWRHGYDAFFS